MYIMFLQVRGECEQWKWTIAVLIVFGNHVTVDNGDVNAVQPDYMSHT
jgi:hypothetical protein